MRLIGLTLLSAESMILRELGDSRWTVYDVLPTFFSHDDVSIELGMGLLGVVKYLADEFFQLLWRCTCAERTALIISCLSTINWERRTYHPRNVKMHSR